MNINESANEIKQLLRPYEALRAEVIKFIEDIDSRSEQIPGDLFNLKPEFLMLENSIGLAIDKITKGEDLPEELKLDVLLKHSQELFKQFT